MESRLSERHGFRVWVQGLGREFWVWVQGFRVSGFRVYGAEQGVCVCVMVRYMSVVREGELESGRLKGSCIIQLARMLHLGTLAPTILDPNTS